MRTVVLLLKNMDICPTLLLFANLITVTSQLQATTPNANPFTTEIDHFARSHPVSFTSQRSEPTRIEFSWSVANTADLTEVANFVVHLYRGRDANREEDLKVVRVPATNFSLTIQNLKPGTYYSCYVVANYTTGHQPHSHTISVRTMGYGPDRRCYCNRDGSNGTLCDKITGQCACKNKYTVGLKCDRCVDGYVWTQKVGCNPCDCDRKYGNGTCRIDENGVIVCNCYHDYGGKKCQGCRHHFYKNETKGCVPCKCHSNADMRRGPICDMFTGKCTNCLYNTTGDHCEKCLPGYEGDPVKAKKCIKNVTADSDSNTGSDSYPAVIVYQNIGLIIGLAVIGLVIIFLVVAVFAYRRWWRWRHKPLQFWTVQLRDDHERVSFSEHPAYQKVDSSGQLLPEDLQQQQQQVYKQRMEEQPDQAWRMPLQYDTHHAVANGSGGKSRPRIHGAGGPNPYQSLA